MAYGPLRDLLKLTHGTDSDYFTAVAKLKPYFNLETIGYMITDYDTRAVGYLFGYCAEAADMIVTKEIAYSSWSDSTMTDIHEEYKGASAILIHNFSTSADVSSIVNSVVDDDIAALYATSDCCHNVNDPTLLDEIAADL
ncbi:hypothetical protein UA08_05044 [Talaromyces atroroseus]|uniref:Uncharacterized protein n=1 Tax=Talaromyces atroroseus TaxID=1441469 RepID=A0A225AEM6_TALAT|nr:hypothetical protein UA08_05044 [Talaromyces atroroseus]OKL59732.1 hypothetical protein UA08_05044 [Talaromyces atroroseus]